MHTARHTLKSEKLPNGYGSVTSSKRNGAEIHELNTMNVVRGIFGNKATLIMGYNTSEKPIAL
jgi:hypothetical protein